LENSRRSNVPQTSIAGKRTIDEERNLVRHVVRLARPDASRQCMESLIHCRLVTDAYPSRGMIVVGELCRDVDLRAAAITVTTHSLPDPIEQRQQLAQRIAGMVVDDLIPLHPELSILPLQKRSDQIIFSAKVAVETRLGHPGFGHDPFDSDRSNAVTIEKVGCRREHTLRGVELINMSSLHGISSSIRLRRPTICTAASRSTTTRRT
jgi:hypothetical protein